MTDKNRTEFSEAIQTRSEFAEALSAGAALTGVHEVDGKAFAVIPDGYGVHDLEYMQTAPSRIRQTVRLHDLPSFATYLEHFGVVDAVVFADIDRSQFTAVMDYHDRETPRHGDHKAVYPVQHSEEWKRWTALDGKPMSQTEFVRFLEENIVDIVEPDGARVLEIAKTLEAKKNVSFKSGVRLSDGDMQLIYVEETEGKGKGDLKVPEKFVLGLPVYYRSERWKVEALLRYRIKEGVLVFWYDLHRRVHIEQDAFDGLVEQVEKVTGAAIVRGVLA